VAAETWRAVAQDGDEVEFRVTAKGRERDERLDLEALAQMLTEGGAKASIEQLRQMKLVGTFPMTFSFDPRTKKIAMRQ
jgi:hypothetical protein